MVLASLTSTIVHWISAHGVEAVLGLMALDALLPVGGELIMLYAGVLASGATEAHPAPILGLTDPAGRYVVLALAGVAGSLVGGWIGWGAGRFGGAALAARAGAWLHMGSGELERSREWFSRFGTWGVLLGRLTPVVRSFISMGAGLAGVTGGRFSLSNLAASVIWCTAFAGAGWALGDGWRSFDAGFHYADYVAVAVAVVLMAVVGARLLRSSLQRRAAARIEG